MDPPFDETPAPDPVSASESAATARRRLLLLVNPHASATSDALRERVTAILARSFTVDVEPTRHKGHGIDLCAAAVRDGCDTVAVLGGDGTLNEAANALARTRTALAPLPGGATNVLCRMLGMPAGVERAAERLAAGTAHERTIDLGRANSRWFTFSAGMGLDASVVERVDARPHLKARWGPWFFAATGLGVFFTRYVRAAPRLRVCSADGELDGVSALIQNGELYTYFRDRPIVLAESAGLESGSLGGAVLTRARAGDVAPVLWRALYGHAPVHEHPRVAMIDTAEPFTVSSRDGRPVPLQVDGDHVGDFEHVEFAVAPGALRLIA